MRKIILNNLWILLIFILIIPAILPLLNSGFFSMHDDQQIARLYELNQSIMAFEFPPRWVSNLGFGFGYPLFNFYPPLVYYFSEIFYLMGFSLINSTKIVMGLGFFLSGIFMYLWCKKHTGEVGALVAAVLYVYAPYHIVDLYIRGAFSEFFSFVWIPAVFWSLDNLSDKKNLKWTIITSIFISFVVLTHNLVALPFIFFLGIYLIFIVIKNKKDFKKIFVKLLIVGILSLGLSAYFWLPALYDKQYTLVDNILTRELANYNIHFVFLSQFWNSPWGYGGSIDGINDGLSFQVGKFQILFSIVSIILSVYLLFRKKKNVNIIYPVFFSFIFSIFMATSFSKPIWDIFQPLSYLQFPWRFLAFAAVFSSFLSGLSIYFLKKIFNYKIALVLGLIIIFGSIVLVIKNLRPQVYLSYSDSNYTTNNDIQWRVSKTSFEYVPKEVATYFSSNNNTQLDIQEKDIPKKSFEIVDGNVILIEEINKPSFKKYRSKGYGNIVLNTYMFPGWSVYIDGNKQDIEKYGKFKLISFKIGDGDHIIEAKFENTPIRLISNIISLISLLLIITIFLYWFFTKSVIIKRYARRK